MYHFECKFTLLQQSSPIEVCKSKMDIKSIDQKLMTMAFKRKKKEI